MGVHVVVRLFVKCWYEKAKGYRFVVSFYYCLRKGNLFKLDGSRLIRSTTL